MLQSFIERTNHPAFYHRYNLRLNVINGTMSYEQNDLAIRFLLEEETDEGPLHIEHWIIKAYNVCDFRKIFASTYLPYIKLELLEEHPLLWQYKYDTLEGELKGKCSNVNECIGRLYELYLKHTGGWIDWAQDFARIRQINYKKTIPLSINIKTYNFVSNLLNEFDLEFDITNIVSTEKSVDSDKHDVKLLLFGNTDVSPHELNLNQPYIIAEHFEAAKDGK